MVLKLKLLVLEKNRKHGNYLGGIKKLKKNYIL
jgi:hypothetical protein